MFEINVPFGEDQYDVMQIVEEELGLFDADVQHWEEDGEPDEELGDDLLYLLYVTPRMVKSWKHKLKAFEELNGFSAGMSWNVEW